jgi:PAS domain S-box-containing protein
VPRVVALGCAAAAALLAAGVIATWVGERGAAVAAGVCALAALGVVALALNGILRSHRRLELAVGDARHRADVLRAELRERGQELAAADERELLFAEVASDAVLFHDGTRILLVGGATTRLFGYGVQELTGAGPRMLVTPDTWSALTAAMTGSRAEGVRVVGVRKNGTRFPVEAKGRCVRYQGRDAHVLMLSDVSDRQAAETARRSVETRFRMLFDEAPIGMGVVDVEGRWLQVNKALCALVGWEPAELLRSDIRAVTSGHDLTRLIESLTAMSSGAELTRDLDLSYVHRSGQRVQVHVSMSAVLADGGSPRCFILQIQDVTFRKEAEDALRASEERYRRIVELADEGIWIVDRDGRTTYANNRMAELLGYPAEEMPGLPVQAVTSDEALVTDPEGVQRALGDDDLDFEFRRSDGSAMWVHVAATPVVDGAGRPQGTLALVTDVTARRQVEEQLRVSEARFRRLADNATDVIYRVRVRPVYAVEYLSPAVTDLTGLRPGDFYADPSLVGKVLHPDDRAAVEAFRDAAGSAVGPLLARVVHVDGSVRWTEHRVVRIPGGGGGLVIEGIGRDVTDRMVTEERLRQINERLRATSRRKTEFLSAISHQLRPPLNSLMILGDLLGRDEAGTLTAEQRAWAVSITSAGRDVVSRVSDVLDLAKLEAGKVEIKESSTLVAQTVAEVVAPFRPEAGQRGIALSVEVDPAVPERIRTDALRVGQILRNLVGNAVKFTPSGAVEVRVERRFGAAGADEIGFAVTDTGVGIPVDKLGVVLDACQVAGRSADASARRRSSGIGLGLSISPRLAAILRGRVEVSSRPGCGSTFTLVLPLVAES